MLNDNYLFYKQGIGVLNFLSKLRLRTPGLLKFDSDFKKILKNPKNLIRNKKYYKSGVESRNSERAFNYALGFADTRFFQGLYGFDLSRGIGSITLDNKISDLVT